MKQEEIYALIISIIVLLIGITYFTILFFREKKKISTKVNISVESLIDALGGKTNIVQTFLDNKRLKITVSNPKLISQTLLKALGVTGMLSGKDVKLLVKDNPIDVKMEIDKIISEVNK